MSRENDKKQDKAIVDAVFDLMYDTDLDSDEDVIERLKSQGLDPKALESKGLSLLADCKREILFSAAAEKKDRFGEFWKNITGMTSLSDRRKSIGSLLSPTDPEQRLVFNRKLETLTDDYLTTLEDDQILLDLWNEFSGDPEK